METPANKPGLSLSKSLSEPHEGLKGSKASAKSDPLRPGGLGRARPPLAPLLSTWGSARRGPPLPQDSQGLGSSKEAGEGS